MEQNVELRQIYEAIGKLGANVEALRRDFDRFEEESRSSRSKMHTRLDDAAERLVKAEGGIKSLEAYSKEAVKPTVDLVDDLRQRGVGFLFAAGLVGTALGSGVALALYSYWGKITKLLQSL